MSGRVRSIVSPAVRGYLKTFEGISIIDDVPWDDDVRYLMMNINYLEGDLGFQDVVIENNGVRFKPDADV